jgi:hypothetical protein
VVGPEVIPIEGFGELLRQSDDHESVTSMQPDCRASASDSLRNPVVATT